jgi:hypothetical protein
VICITSQNAPVPGWGGGVSAVPYTSLCLVVGPYLLENRSSVVGVHINSESCVTDGVLTAHFKVRVAYSNIAQIPNSVCRVTADRLRAWR